MKILVTGAGGMLGSDLFFSFKRSSLPVFGIVRNPKSFLTSQFQVLDLLDARGLDEVFTREKPDVIFHAAAMTQVDDCETNAGYEQAQRDNVEVSRILAEMCSRYHVMLVFFSTDYVFDGEKNGPYLEEDTPNPVSKYGKTKLDAENVIRKTAKDFSIFRISWLYGLRGRSFPRTIFEKVSSKDVFEIVDDQIGRPTYTLDLAESFAQKIKNEGPSFLNAMRNQVFHLGNEGACSWADLGRKILEFVSPEKKVIPISSATLSRPAKRPANSVLSLEKAQTALGIQLRSWDEAVIDFLKVLQSEHV